jgi:four helix bundle protein
MEADKREDWESPNRNINRGYRKLDVWRDAIEYYAVTCAICRGFPYELKRMASNQMASVDSIHRNIAEGYCRRSIKEYIQFLYVALSSAGESVSGLHAYRPSDLPVPPSSNLPSIPSSNLPVFHSSSLGTQLPPPFRRAFRIAVQGIRIRLGRSLVTLSGVVLGIAFLMSTVTTQFVDRAVAREREARQQLRIMESVLSSRIGSVEGKILGVAVFGTLTPVESALLVHLRGARPAELRIHGVAQPGFVSVGIPDLGSAAAAVLLLGDAPVCPTPLDALTRGMTVPLVVDSLVDRQCQPSPAVRRELFFGRQLEDQQARQARKAAQDRFRVIWIVIVSLAVTVIGVANALLMSVTERFREIGTMKCLGALSVFIRRLFLIESALIGLAGSVIGVIAGVLLTLVVYGVTYGFALVFGSLAYGPLLLAALAAVVTGTVLAMVAALYPARFASRMVPATALRSTV